ncbi:MAG: CHAT domain-containing protein [Coleofasciculus sp. Co-bin14]|nr:CHAT domain-containing protein [Coleofasciculus sp. Co-bin14]
MPPKRLLARLLRREHSRALAKVAKGIVFILLALLTLVSITGLSAEQVAGTKTVGAGLPVFRPESSIVDKLAPTSLLSQADRASQLAVQGKQLYEAGQFSEAAKVWQQAADSYAQVGDKDGMTQSLINAAEAHQALGLYPRACNTLLQAFGIPEPDCQKLTQENENRQQRQYSLLKNLEAQPNSLNKAIGLRSLGDIFQRLDDLDLSQKVLQLSLQVAKALPSPQDESATLLSLGNTEQAKGNRERTQQDSASEQKPAPLRCLYRPSKGKAKKFYQQAALFYQQAATESASPTTWIQAQLNRLNVLLETEALSEAQDLWPSIQSKLRDLPSSRMAVYAQINLAQSLTCLKQASAVDSPLGQEIAQVLAIAVRQAKNLGDQRAESFALGYLAGLYAQAQKQPEAQDLTQQALMLAQSIKAQDITYQWQWQLGYLLRTKGDIKGAMPKALREASIAAYTEAFNTLQSLRSDLAATSSNIQFSFQQSVEPVYRQLVDLLLQSSNQGEATQKNLRQARDAIEALQRAELENLLRCSLQTAKLAPIDQKVDPTAAVIYPIILDDRIEVILSLYKQPLRHYSSSLPKDENVEDLLDRLRLNLQNRNGAGPGFLKLSQQVYGWLIEPLDAELEKSGVKTLVFVLDSPLRNIPMATLHDGQRYLIEKYAVALSPSLQLLEPKPLSDKQLEVLAAGIFQKLPDVPAPALPEVKQELERISQMTKSLVLRNQEFTRLALENKINSRPFSVVHLATHGQFSSQPEQTYIHAWDDRININELNTLLRSREQRRPDAIELLVLSACETASGDKRAALGLAGVAVRAGARSTLATLWSVNDKSTAELMSQFYKTLSNPADSTVTKAKALQSAQLDLLRKYTAPFYWAPYVLIGNWL